MESASLSDVSVRSLSQLRWPLQLVLEQWNAKDISEVNDGFVGGVAVYRV